MATLPHEALASYRAARAAWTLACERGDAAFARYFSRLKAGERTHPGAAARMANLANYASTDLYSAQSALYALNLDPWDVDDADGVERTPLGS